MRLTALAMAVALAALVPTQARGFQWTARAGADYRRQDAWQPDGARTTLPRLDVNLALDARGFVATPETLDWNAAVGYRRLAVTYDAGEEENLTEGLTYRLRAIAFGSRRSPFSLSAHAERSQDERSVGSEPSGTTDTESYGASARLLFRDRPRLELGYVRMTSALSNPILGDSHTERDVLTASTQHGTSTHSYSASYRGMRSTGTFASDDFDEHRADVTASAHVGPRTKLLLTDGFYRRTPTTPAASNPRQDANSFVLRLAETPRDGSRDFRQAIYSYVTGYSEAAAQATSSRAAHRASYEEQRALGSPEWWVRGTVSLSYEESALGDAMVRSAGQSLRALTYWRRGGGVELSEVRAGPTVGLLERFDGRFHLGYGATGGATLQRRLAALLVRGRYDLDYLSEVAVPGWSLSQRLMLGVDGRLGRGTLTGQIDAWARRSDTALHGDTASRSLSGLAAYGTRHSRLELRVGTEDGLAGALRDPGGGDGLFLAPAYDSHVRFASALASTALARNLALFASGRVTSTSLPDRPDLQELEGRGGITYRLGAFGLALDDRYVISSGDGRSRRVNEVFVRAYRAFGGGQGHVRR